MGESNADSEKVKKIKSAYEILGVTKTQGGNESAIDSEVEAKFKIKLDEIHKKIRGILDRQPTDEELEEAKKNPKTRITYIKKLDEIEDTMQELFKCMLAYSKLKNQKSRNEYENANIEDEAKNIKQNLDRVLRIRGRRGYDNAFQILGISAEVLIKKEDSEKKKQDSQKEEASQALKEESQNEEKKDSQKKEDPQAIKTETIQRRVFATLNAQVPKNTYRDIEGTLKMFEFVQNKMWAYSKLKTAARREEYEKELGILRIQEEAEDKAPFSGRVERKKRKEPISFILQSAENGKQQVILSEVGKLDWGDIPSKDGKVVVEGSVRQFLFESYENETKVRRVIYSNIDMMRLKLDTKYAEFVKNMLSDQNVLFARRYLGGYIGEIKDRKATENKGVIFEQDYNLEKVAICRAFQKEQRRKRQGNINKDYENPPPPSDDAR